MPNKTQKVAFVVALLPMAVVSRAYCATIAVPSVFPTIQAGIDAASDGDTVLVAPGVYFERIDFHGKTISLVSEAGAAQTVIDAQSLGTVISIQSGEGDNTTVQGFTIRNGAATFGAGISLLGTSPHIVDNVFANNSQSSGGSGAGIDLFVASPVIANNEFFNNTCDTQFSSGVLSFANGSSPLVYNNSIHDNPCVGINATIPIEAYPVVFNNTIVRNRMGIYIDHRISNSNQTYRNNLIAQNQVGLEVVSGVTPTDAIWTNNLVFGNAEDFSGTSDPTGTNGNLRADPLFADSVAGDFHVLPGSPAVDAGTVEGLSVSPEDLDGNERIQDGDGDGVASIDIGAYEASLPPPNEAPIAFDKTVNGVEDSASAISLQASDADGDPLTYSVVAAPHHGALTGSGANRIYTPAPDFNGSDSFTFIANDGKASSNVATVSISITGANDAPVAYGQTQNGIEDTTLPLTLQATDVDGDVLTYSIVGAPQHGTLSGSGAARTYTPAANYHGTDSFTFIANDGHASSNVATVDIAIASINDAPVAVADTTSTPRNIAVNIAVLANDTDIDGDSLAIVSISGPTHGTAMISGTKVVYTPAKGYTGSDQFTYSITDGHGGMGSANVIVSVTKK